MLGFRRRLSHPRVLRHRRRRRRRAGEEERFAEVDFRRQQWDKHRQEPCERLLLRAPRQETFLSTLAVWRVGVA
jgi:hypothetical protein